MINSTKQTIKSATQIIWSKCSPAKNIQGWNLDNHLWSNGLEKEKPAHLTQGLDYDKDGTHLHTQLGVSSWGPNSYLHLYIR